MAFQSVIRALFADGIVGDSALSGPQRAQPMLLKSADPALNVIGSVFTQVAGQDGNAVAGGAGVFAGILTNSKLYASYGNLVDGPLGPTMTLPNNTPVQLTTTHPGLYVMTKTTANIGDGVCFEIATGKIAAAPNNTPPALHTLIPGASFIRNNITTANTMAVIQLTNS